MVDSVPAMDAVEDAIRRWAKLKGAGVSLRSYAAEIQSWKDTTRRSRVRRLLEIGCGSGLFLLCAVATGFAHRGEGIDPAEGDHGTDDRDIAETQQLLSALNMSERVRVGRGTFQEVLRREYRREFDLLVFRHSLHHIYPRVAKGRDDASVVKACVQDLARAREALTEQGCIYVLESASPNWVYGILYNSWRRRRGLRRIEWEEKRRKHEWVSILEMAGFRDVVASKIPLNRCLETPARRWVGKLFSSSWILSGRR